MAGEARRRTGGHLCEDFVQPVRRLVCTKVPSPPQRLLQEDTANMDTVVDLTSDESPKPPVPRNVRKRQRDADQVCATVTGHQTVCLFGVFPGISASC